MTADSTPFLAPEHPESQQPLAAQDSTPFFHQSILWIMTAACCMTAQDSTPFLAPEHSVITTAASFLAAAQDNTPFFHQSIL
jgi:hypothetical protein